MTKRAASTSKKKPASSQVHRSVKTHHSAKSRTSKTNKSVNASSKSAENTVSAGSSASSARNNQPELHTGSKTNDSKETRSALAKQASHAGGRNVRRLAAPLVWFWDRKWGVVYLIIVVASLMWVASESVRQSTADARYDLETSEIADIPQRPIAIVFGAGVAEDDQPTPYLKNRVATAVDLLQEGRVSMLLMSGNNSPEHNRETTAMKTYAVSLGASPEAIIEDETGNDTFASCQNAAVDYEVTRAVVVTQGYHLPRAVITCRELGIDTIGVAAERSGRDYTYSYLAREHAATMKAMAELFVIPAIKQL